MERFPVNLRHHDLLDAAGSAVLFCKSKYIAVPSPFCNIMPQLARSAGATEALKATDPMKWVGLMNACRAQAEEIAKFELIYV